MFDTEKKFVVFLGHKLRKLRKEHYLTQLDLARQVGITNGQISTIERGVSSPSISTLHRISMVLSVPMAEFFEDEVNRGIHITPRDSGRKVAGTGEKVDIQVLAERGGHGGFNAVFLSVGLGGLCVAPKPRAAEEYFLYVIRGKCNLRLDTDSYALETGDSVYLNARREQWIENVGTGSFEALLISQSVLIGGEVQTFLAQANG